MPRSRPADGDAAAVIVNVVRQNPGIILVTLGPLTNVARAIQLAPDMATAVERCVIMGGAACTVGNITPAAEFNLWVDPDAAAIVFGSGLPIELVGWELCRFDANLDDDERAYVKGFHTALADFAIDCNATAIRANRHQSGDPGLALPDPVAMAIAIDPSVCTRRSAHRVLIEVESDLTRGMTVVDQLDVYDYPHNDAVWGHLREPNAMVCWEIDVPAWKEMLYSTLR
jgi:purine nucleosidase